MPQIFQSFDLDLEAMAKLSREDLFRLNLPQSGRTLREELSRKGYDVLESNDSFSGVALRVIVCGDIRMSHNEDFYQLAQRLGLMYGSGAYYTKRE